MPKCCTRGTCTARDNRCPPTAPAPTRHVPSRRQLHTTKSNRGMGTATQHTQTNTPKKKHARRQTTNDQRRRMEKGARMRQTCERSEERSLTSPSSACPKIPSRASHRHFVRPNPRTPAPRATVRTSPFPRMARTDHPTLADKGEDSPANPKVEDCLGKQPSLKVTREDMLSAEDVGQDVWQP